MSLTPQTQQELLHLVFGLCDGELSDAEFARLEEMLDDAQCRLRYLEYVELHSGLAIRARRNGLIPYPPTTEPAPVGTAAACALPLQKPTGFFGPRFSFARITRYTVVAAIALGISFFIQVHSPPAVPTQATADPGPIMTNRTNPLKKDAAVATLRLAVDCTWETPIKVIDEGTRLATGEYRLSKGVATIDFDSGSALVVEGPAIIRIESSTAATLKSGKAVFRADESAAPFALHTPTSTLEDFDTEFAVSVNEQAEEVHVREGKVERTANAAVKDAKPEELKAGEARRYEGAPMAVSKPMQFDPQRFVRSVALPRPDPAHNPTLLAYEGFAYRSPYAIASGKANGGFGWAGPWKPGISRPPFAFDGNRGLRPQLNVNESLTRGSKTKHHGGSFGYAGFSKTWRRLAHPVRLDGDGVYYLSYLFRRDQPARHPVDCTALLFWTDDDFQAKRNEFFWKRLNIGIRNARLYTSLQRMIAQRPASTKDGVAYLLVAKIAASQQGHDQVFASVFGPEDKVGSAEPNAWTLRSAPFRSDLVFDWVQLHVNSGARHTIDEIRLGTTWASVTAPWAATN